MNSIKNFGQKIVLYTSLVLLSLTISNALNAQNNSASNKENNKNQSSSWEDKRRQEAMKAYLTLDNAVLNHVASASNNDPNIKQAISTLEIFLGEELYHGSLAGIQTLPASGKNSILFENGEYQVHVVQVGAGTWEKKKYSYVNFSAEELRDFSFTLPIYANKVGYDGMNPNKSDERLIEIIAMNTDLMPTDIKIQRDNSSNTGKIRDIVYTGTDKEVIKSLGMINDHRLPAGGKIPNHILWPRGKDFYLPLTDISEIVGLTQIEYVSTPCPESEPEIKHDTIKIPIYLVPKGGPVTPPAAKIEEKDSIEYRMVLLGSSTNVKNPGLRLGLQLGKSNWDIEVGYDVLNPNKVKTDFKDFTEEHKENPNMHNYVGHSTLTEKGLDNIHLNNASISLIYHVGKKRNFGVLAGVNASVIREKYDGKEQRTTWIENSNGQTVPDSYDTFSTDVEFNNSDKPSIMISPQIGARAYIGRFVLGGDWIINVSSDPHSKYATKYEGLGELRFSFGLNFGPSKSDKEKIAKRLGRTNQYSSTPAALPASTQSSTGNSNVMYEYVQKK